MKLYHVSTLNKDLQILDLSMTHKTDMDYTGKLVTKIEAFDEFCEEYYSQRIQELSKRKGWIREKVATEAIFEGVRLKKFREKPSRLISTYFTNSIENAKMFNITQRENRGAIFVFEAEKENIFYFNMDLFHEACECFRVHGMNEESFEIVKDLAKKYWQGYKKPNNSNCEILYNGEPILHNITK